MLSTQVIRRIPDPNPLQGNFSQPKEPTKANPLKLSDSAYTRLASQGRIVTFNVGEKVITPDGIILIVEKGEIECFVRDAFNKKHLLNRLTKGEVVGELSSLISEKPNDQKVFLKVVSKVTALEVNAALFFDIKSKEPLAVAAFDQMAARRLDAMNVLLINMVGIDQEPANAAPRTLGEKCADFVAEKFGRWSFLVVGASFTVIYMGINMISGMAWDPYPYIFLNLLFSTLSGFTAPILLMSQNRQSQVDRNAAQLHYTRTNRQDQILESNTRMLKRIEKKVDNIRVDE